jgi:hypothetical protein
MTQTPDQTTPAPQTPPNSWSLRSMFGLSARPTTPADATPPAPRPSIQDRIAARMTPEQQADYLRRQADPSEVVFQQLARNDAIRNNEQARLALGEIAADSDFRNKLNNAIRTDSTVAPGLVALSRGGAEGASGLDVAQLVQSLADPANRGMMGGLLDRAAQPVPAGQTFNLC